MLWALNPGGKFMTRRFEVGPLLVALAAVVLLVSLFLEWYGPLTAWEVFEITEVLLLALAVAALLVAFGQIVPDVGWIERRYMPAIVLAIAVIVVAVLVDPPPAAGPEEPSTGAWLALAAVLLMLSGAVLSFGKVSFAVNIEGRGDARERVAVVDHRQDTTETAAVSEDVAPRRSMWRGNKPPEEGDATEERTG
jgi:peptidoglycan/LPS O-acetylase OafA/YrhL